MGGTSPAKKKIVRPAHREPCRPRTALAAMPVRPAHFPRSNATPARGANRAATPQSVAARSAKTAQPASSAATARTATPATPRTDPSFKTSSGRQSASGAPPAGARQTRRWRAVPRTATDAAARARTGSTQQRTMCGAGARPASRASSTTTAGFKRGSIRAGGVPWVSHGPAPRPIARPAARARFSREAERASAAPAPSAPSTQRPGNRRAGRVRATRSGSSPT